MPRYLVVDDSASVRRLVATALRKLEGVNAEVTEAGDFEQARSAFEQKPPDVVFLDMLLGSGPGGVVLLDHFLQKAVDLPVVIISGLPRDHPTIVEAMSKGAFGFLEKPLRRDAIRAVLEELEQERGRLGRIS